MLREWGSCVTIDMSKARSKISSYASFFGNNRLPKIVRRETAHRAGSHRRPTDFKG
jgi:hypothetical protein